jgi:hypothetical protein
LTIPFLSSQYILNNLVPSLSPLRCSSRCFDCHIFLTTSLNLHPIPFLFLGYSKYILLGFVCILSTSYGLLFSLPYFHNYLHFILYLFSSLCSDFFLSRFAWISVYTLFFILLPTVILWVSSIVTIFCHFSN